MADKNAVKAAIDQHSERLGRQPGVVGFGVTGKSGDQKLAVYVSTQKASASIPKQVIVTRDGKSDTVDVEVVEIGALKPGT